MILVTRVGLFIFALGMLGLVNTVAHAQQWNGVPGSDGTVWRSGNVALGFEPARGGAPSALLEIRQPISGTTDPLLFSAIATFQLSPSQNTTGHVFEVDTRRVYAGGAREKAAVLPSGAYDFATYGGVAIGLRNINKRISPDYMLTVGGKVLAEEVRIMLISAWADYVFEPDYRLKSLREVEAFIRDHHRLPDIPSAADVTERGIDLGRMQSTLLAKIEELTLYVIEQKKDLEALQGKVMQLEQENATLTPTAGR